MNNNELIIDAINRETALSPEERLNEDYNRFMKPYFIDRNVEYPDPEYLIEIGGVPTMPKGNLVAVSAKWKNGKTFFCDILTAIFMGSDHFVNCRSLKDTGRALFFDTEQSDRYPACAKDHRCDVAPEPSRRLQGGMLAAGRHWQ